MAYERVGEARWVMWIGLRQWEGLPGEFDVGQTGWVYPKDDPVGYFVFFPAFGSQVALLYEVPCVAEDFLSFTLRENA